MALKIFDLRTPAVLKSEVKQFICACESLISAIDRRTAFSQDELRLIKLYVETTQQSTASVLLSNRKVGLCHTREQKWPSKRGI